VGGLGREAFKIDEHGKAREATIFEEMKTEAPTDKARVAVNLTGHSNFNLGDGRNWRITVVVLDMINTPYLAQHEGRKRLIAYLSKSLQRDEPTALFGLGRKGLKQLHPFTTDTAVLIAALKRINGQVGTDEINEQSEKIVGDEADMVKQLASISHLSQTSEAAQQVSDFMNDMQTIMDNFEEREAIRTTLKAMSQIAHAYEAIPGRKTMIWVSGGFPFMIDDPQVFARMGMDMTKEYEDTWHALIAADIAVYTVDVTGLGGVGVGMPTGHYDGTRPQFIAPNPRAPVDTKMSLLYDKAAQRQDTLRAFADATGGASCLNTNDIEDCFGHALKDSREYYLLGYYLPSGEQKPGWRKLKVKVNVEGVHVRARQGFYVSGPTEDTVEARQRQLVDALRSPVEFTGVRINVREEPVSGDVKHSAGKSARDFLVGVIGSSMTVDTQNGNAVDLTVVSIAIGANGRNAGQTERHVSTKLTPQALEQIRRTGLGVKQSLELAPGKYDVRFAVRDNLNGEIGTVEYPLEVK